ncbi:MAG: type I-E CRISPR-associated protein Cse2/CasB [Candidatus Competibacteraceae bacterium]|nr:type I-E CRISPR-associated protein Cse2/CasB [Candidatus Competibacteraceae bacterium]
MNSPKHSEPIDYTSLLERFNQMPPGQKAELRRAAQPGDLTMKPALYRLLRGIKPNPQYLRVAFLLPWAKHRPNAMHFSAQCAKAKINEIRMFQIARSDDPMDMVQLRRIAMQIEPHVDWTQFGDMLRYWPDTKHEFIESYYLAQYSKKEPGNENE